MDQLPTEMKQEIFGFLNKKDLISVASTCKNLRSFILKSKCLMEYLTFKLMDFEAQQDYIANYGCGLVRICIGPEDTKGRSMKLNQTDMKLVISSIPNVQEMQINQLILPATKKPVEDLQLPLIKKLILKNGGNNDKIFNFLHGFQVLELISSMDKIENRLKSFSDNFWTWFNAQTELKSVSLQSYAIHNFFNKINVNDVQIKLKKLALTSELIDTGTAMDLNNLFEFLKQQDEIEEIELEKFGDFGYLNEHQYLKVVKQIMFGMQGLKIFKLNGNLNLPDLPEVNLALEKLVFDTTSFSTYALSILQNFPNTKNLKLINRNIVDCFYDGYYYFLGMDSFSKMIELEKLKIYDCTLGGFMSDIEKFQKLKKLTLAACHLSSSDWKLLVAQTPLLEKLKLDMFQLSNDSVRLFIKWPKLKQLDLRFGYYQDELVNLLCQCPAFNHLKITKSTKTQFADQLKDVDFKVEILTKSLDKEYKYRVDYFLEKYRILTESAFQCNKDDLSDY